MIGISKTYFCVSLRMTSWIIASFIIMNSVAANILYVSFYTQIGQLF